MQETPEKFQRCFSETDNETAIAICPGAPIIGHADKAARRPVNG
jgi:hypothetical protein